MNDIRWRQRLQNFENAFQHLKTALNIINPDLIQKAGLIQFFEMNFELAWNTLKDYLEHQGYTEIRSPRATIKKAFEIGLIIDGQLWMQLLEDRNLTAHAYDEQRASEIEKLIRQNYFPLFEVLLALLKSKVNE